MRDHGTLRQFETEPPRQIWLFFTIHRPKILLSPSVSKSLVDSCSFNRLSWSLSSLLALHTEGGLVDLLKPQLTDYFILEDTWSIITFQPWHLNFRIYNPTLILVDLLCHLRLSTPSIRGHEHESHLILMLLEKGYKPESLGLGKGELAHFSIKASWEILEMYVQAPSRSTAQNLTIVETG